MKEGDDVSITCLPSSLTVALEWNIPITAVHGGAIVEYDGPLQHEVRIRNAQKNHEGNYTCSVVGDSNGVIPTSTTFIRVRESKYLHCANLQSVL